MSVMVVLHLALVAVTLGMVISLLFMRQALIRSLGHGEVNRITAAIAEAESAMLDVRREIRVDLDALHKRLEYLERLERERPNGP